MTTPPRVAYVVQRVGWTFNDQWYYRDGKEDDVPLVAYATRDRAEAERMRLERVAWKEAGSPLDYGCGIESVSSMSEAEFQAFLETIDLFTEELRGGRDLDWGDWWDAVEDTLTDDQREAIWEMMDKLRLFEVVEVEVGGGL